METIWLLYASFVFSLVLAYKIFTPGRSKLPPSPGPALPLIGHLHLLKKPVHRSLHELSEKRGPIFSLRLGSRLAVVVSSLSLVEECFTRNDIVLANRPRFIAGKYLGYDHTNIVDLPYGELWRNLRRLCALELFAPSRLSTFLSSRQDEIRLFLRKLYQNSRTGFAKVELKSMFFELSFNVITRMIDGKRYFGEDEDDQKAKQFRELVNEVFRFANLSNAGDFVSVLRWIDYQDYEKNVAGLGERTDTFLQGLIDKHRLHKSENTMIDHLISLRESEPEYYTDTVIKGILMVILTAGIDTTAITIEWAMTLLLNHHDKLEKAKVELDNHVGNDSLIEECELSKLPYLQNVISETFRLFPAVPLLLPHESSDVCTLGGFQLPARTMLLVNAWAIHRDPTVWDDPESFKPERFQAEEIGSSRLLPFGTGRRSCPGANLAQRVVGLTLASVIQCFEWKRVNDEKLDLTEGVGLTMPKALPLEAECRARHILHKVFPS